MTFIEREGGGGAGPRSAFVNLYNVVCHSLPTHMFYVMSVIYLLITSKLLSVNFKRNSKN